jgi:hypothetical protein
MIVRGVVILFLLNCVGLIRGQDTIYFVNKTKLAVIVKEIGSKTVAYKRFDNQEGPNYVYEKSDIFLIKYSSGQTDTISSFYKEEPVPQKTKEVYYEPVIKRNAVVFKERVETPVDSNSLRFYKGWLYQGYTEISMKRFIFLTDSLAAKKNISELKLLSDKVRLNHSKQRILAFCAIPVALTGVGLLGIAALEYRLSSGRSDVTGLNVAAALFGTAGLGLEITSLINGSRKNKNMQKAMDLYNQNR